MARTGRTPLIDATRCTGCGRCIAACALPLFAFETQAWKKTAVLQDVHLCTGCSQCEVRCPVGAISMQADGADHWVHEQGMQEKSRQAVKPGGL